LSKIEEKEFSTNYLVIFGLSCIVSFGLIVRFFYFPDDIPIVTDGYISFLYASKTVLDGALPVGYSVVNSGWSYFLSLLFVFSDKMDPLQLMDIQRSTSIVISSITAIPLFFILKKFATVKWALFGSFLIVIEPRLLLMSIEGINYSLFLFLFILSIALFLKKTNLSLVCSFICIAFLALVRYEGILLIIPLSISYFIKFRDKKTTYRYLLMIFVIAIILIPIAGLRIQATEEICMEYSFIKFCGDDGITSHLIGGIDFFIRHIVLNSQEQSEEFYKVDNTSTMFHKEKYTTNDSNFIPALQEILYRLVKFVGLSLFPIFGVLILLNFITQLKVRNKINLEFNSIVVLLCSGAMILPALYAYVRGIDDLRYVLILIPLFCILSITFKRSGILKRLDSRYAFVIFILFVIFSSIIFTEYNKRDYDYENRIFTISQELVKRTDVTNYYNHAGYLKVAMDFYDWPEFSKTYLEKNGKLTYKVNLISTEKSSNIEEFIIESRNEGLKFIVVDKDTKLLESLEDNSKRFSYLTKVFDYDNFDLKNEFSIYEINYELFDLRT
tara:strand:- start:351 stop:2018 length:1668 start_codon:yes stop_codon:yes gene_type:complete